MARFSSFLSILVAVASFRPTALTAAAAGAADPYFSNVPFHQWLAESNRPHIHWSARLTDPVLSVHQRLLTRIQVTVDGAELAKRRGRGTLAILTELTDDAGRNWQNHLEADLTHVEANASHSDAEFLQTLFVLPGDYRVSIAFYASATGEHGVLKRRLHVGRIRGDPWPESSTGLPAVEFVPDPPPPSSWYLPSIDGRLHLNVHAREPIHVDVIVNLSPSGRFAGSSRAQERNLGSLLPAAKLLSQVDWGTAPFRLELLDLTRRRIAWGRTGTGAGDWSTAAGSLDAVNPGIIDVRALEGRQYSAAFFINEISRRIARAQAGKPHRIPVVIVLSPAFEFDSLQELHPILPGPASEARIYYLRYRPPVVIRFGGPPARSGPPLLVDQLAPLLKALEPRLFDVGTPEQFRKAMAAILAEISRL